MHTVCYAIRSVAYPRCNAHEWRSMMWHALLTRPYIMEDDAAAALHNEALRCLASLLSACGEREGAVLALTKVRLT